MKTFILRNWGGILALALFALALPLHAQQEKTIIIIKEKTNADGTTTIEKQVITDTEDIQDALEKRSEGLRMQLEDFAPEHFDWQRNFEELGLRHHRNPCDVFIGVVTEVTNGKLLVTEVVDNTPAQKAGVRVGDVLVAMDNVPVNSQDALIAQRNKHGQGDPFSLQLQRNGGDISLDARFKACTEAEKAEFENRENDVFLFRTLRHDIRLKAEPRNPCDVFIGVYTSTGAGDEGKGVQITGVIEDTPAKIGGVQSGDVIVAVDGTPVNNYLELRRERDKHKPGDKFQMTVLREGAPLTIYAQFKNCDKNEPAKVVEDEVIVREQPTAVPELENQLQLETLEVFPNPTAGPVNVRFTAEAVPTTVRIIDASGRTVYSKTLSQFGGQFNEEIDLGNNRPGNLTLTIEQNGKAASQKIVLVNRA
ncbi:MAG: PDZ domain-containing protein [Saprospiraceae bacterium]|nr:PDZ domain-containing protein [Saprospiraceae bacterium]